MRRIKKELRDLFEKQQLTDREIIFIDGCLKHQHNYPQLTQNQWKIILEIEAKYKKHPIPKTLKENDC